MIGRLQGKLLVKAAPQLLIDVGGVGYEVEAPMTTFYVLPECGQNIVLHTHFIVREDAQLLYGFASEAERRMFRDLIKVNGVGAKMALAILSSMSADSFAQCVRDSDVAGLVRVPGVGKKTAERLIVEMKDRIGVAGDFNASASDIAGAELFDVPKPVDDAISALVALGYKVQEAERMIKKIDVSDLASEDIIRQALKASFK